MLIRPAFYQALILESRQAVSNSICNLLKLENIECLRANTTEEAEKILKENKKLNLVIASQCEAEGTSSCYKILDKLKESSRSIPLIVITKNASDHRLELLEAGAFRVLEDPFEPAILLLLSRNFVRHSEIQQKLETAENIIIAFSEAIEARDTYTQGHSRRVAEFSIAIYDALQFRDRDEREALYIGCLLHDIGKIGVPDSILKSSKPLTPNQRKKINKHPGIGYRICKGLTGLAPALDIILHHHEKLDGSGYPKGLEGDSVPKLCQIVVIADIYDALTTKRTYRDLSAAKRALQIMEEEEVNTGKINKEFFDVFKYNILQNGVKK